MNYFLTTNITINAPISRVWKTFTQFENYPQWNTFIKSVEGEMRQGARLNNEIIDMKFRPVIKVWKPEEELTWLGSVGIPYIFDGRHTFRFVANPDGTTTFYHEEKFRGILVPFTKKKLKTEIREGFEHFNKTLKAKVEE